MKKRFCIIGALIFIMSLCTVASAKTGDVIGHIYSTDIIATINGVAVPSYNIGGKTAIIVEDVKSKFTYNDTLRVLLIGDFDPMTLIESAETEKNDVVGRIVGDIYETDIEVYARGTKVKGYSLNGKMAVCIEDLGGDGTFSLTGGRYFWNADERTIALEYLYSNSIGSILSNKHANMEIGDGRNATFISKPIMHGDVEGQGRNSLTESVPEPIMYGDVIIGYQYNPQGDYYIDRDDNGVFSLQKQKRDTITYYYTDRIEAILKDFEVVNPTREDWLAHFEEQMMTVIKSFETEEYTFLYMTQTTSHGTSHLLTQILKDGTKISYSSELGNIWGTVRLKDVEIDEENQKVTFICNEVRYEIDLKSHERTEC